MTRGRAAWGLLARRHGCVSRAGLALLVAATLTTGALPAPTAAQTDRPEVTSLEVRGNRAFPDDSLRAAIVNRQTECRLPSVFCLLGINLRERNYLQPRELALDVLRLGYFYRQRGYREAVIDTTVTREDGEVRVRFDIDEGRPVLVDSIDVVLWDPVPDSSFLRGLPLTPGDALSDLRIDAARDSLTARLRNDGFAHAEVLTSNFVPAGSYTGRVTFEVYPGVRARFGEIRVSGTEELDSTSVLRMLPFREGGLYRAAQIEEGQRNLYSLELIQSARIVQVLEPGDTTIEVEVRVAEGQEHRVRTGIGWTTLDCLNAEARWSSRNFAGGARRLTVRGRVSNILAEELRATACNQAGSGEFAQLNGQLSVELFQPWLVSPRNSLTLNAFVERQSVPDVFIRRALGLNVAVSRTLGRRTVLTLGYQPALTQLDAAEIFLCSSFLACLPSDVSIFRDASWLSPIALRLSQDQRNSALDPSRGFYWLVNLEHARDWTGSDFSFDRGLAEASAYAELRELVVAGRLRAGAVGAANVQAGRAGAIELIHPQKRFFAGGANSVRGFVENVLGPRMLSTSVERILGVEPGASAPVCTPEELESGVLCDPSPLPDDAFRFRPVGGAVVLEANLEMRFPLFVPQLQGVAFVDAGQVWVNRDLVRLRDLATSPGVGVRYMSPIGPVRVDLAYGHRRAEQLPATVELIRRYDPLADDPSDRITVRGADGTDQVLDWVRTDQLNFLFPSRAFGGGGSFLSRLQLHISLGQAF